MPVHGLFYHEWNKTKHTISDARSSAPESPSSGHKLLKYEISQERFVRSGFRLSNKNAGTTTFGALKLIGKECTSFLLSFNRLSPNSDSHNICGFNKSNLVTYFQYCVIVLRAV